MNFDPSTKKSKKICTLIGPFRSKYTTFDLKKLRRSIFHDTEELSKIEEKMTCGLENDKQFGKFSSEYLKMSKYFHVILLSKVENA